MKITESLSLLFLLFLALSSLASAADYTPTENILLNCGGDSNLTDRENRTWIPDTKSKFFSSGDSKPSQAATKDPYLPEVPYKTARIFQSPFTYTFPVAAGPKFVRLYFHPNTYEGLNATSSLFSVSFGSFTLLKNFSAAQTAKAMDCSSIVKEFVLNVEGSGNMSMTFTPQSKKAYAFVNGIEVTTMPHLYTIDRFTALESVHRVNVGGDDITPSQDTLGLYRSWVEDTPYVDGAFSGLVVAEPRLKIKYPRGTPKSIAPHDVYSTARTMSQTSELNLQFNLTWSFKVDTGFNYTVRLHFCEVYPKMDKINQRVFIIYVNNIIVEPKADIVRWAGGSGITWHKDYIVNMANGKNMRIALHPNEKEKPEYYDSILNGVEIFKMNASDGNLAGPNPIPEPRVMSAPSKVVRRRGHESNKRMMYVSVVAVLVVIGCSAAVILACTCRKKKPARASDVRECRQFTLSEMKEATKNFDESRVLGNGGFGKVYLGEIEETKVAIKRANPKSDQGVCEFQTEIRMLSKLRHRHLVSFIGFCDENGEMMLVYEYMANGTMKEHLYKTKNAPLPWKQRLEICIGAARGLHYLHTGTKQAIIHRDVKTTNILLDENWVAKFSDFGLAKTDPSLDHQTHDIFSAVKGTIGYLDPEYYRRQQLTLKSDVYAFGVVLLEAICTRSALDLTLADEQKNLSEWAANCYKKGVLDQIIDPYLKDKITPECFRKFAETAVKCVRDQGIERPSMGDVLWNLEFALQLQEESGKGIGASDESNGGGVIGNEDFDGLELPEVFAQMLRKGI